MKALAVSKVLGIDGPTIHLECIFRFSSFEVVLLIEEYGYL